MSSAWHDRQAAISVVPSAHKQVRAELASLQALLSSISRTFQNNMGNSAGRVTEHGNASQTDALFKLLSEKMPVRRVNEAGLSFCEIGFNVGHSAVTFLKAAAAIGVPVTNYLIFDLVANRATMAGLSVVNASFPSTRFRLLPGMSEQTLPDYFASGGTPRTCDLIHIDGDHLGKAPSVDWNNVQPLARSDAQTLVIFDDCGCAWARKMVWCVEPTRVFDKAVSNGQIQVVSRGVLSWPAKGSCAGLIQNTARS